MCGRRGGGSGGWRLGRRRGSWWSTVKVEPLGPAIPACGSQQRGPCASGLLLRPQPLRSEPQPWLSLSLSLDAFKLSSILSLRSATYTHETSPSAQTRGHIAVVSPCPLSLLPPPTLRAVQSDRERDKQSSFPRRSAPPGRPSCMSPNRGFSDVRHRGTTCPTTRPTIRREPEHGQPCLVWRNTSASSPSTHAGHGGLHPEGAWPMGSVR